MIDPHLSGADHDQPDLATEPTRSNSAVRTRLHSRSYRASKRLPAWMGSIRFRLTAVWSVLVFGLAALVVGGIYLGLHNLRNCIPGWGHHIHSAGSGAIGAAVSERTGSRRVAGVFVLVVAGVVFHESGCRLDREWPHAPAAWRNL